MKFPLGYNQKENAAEEERCFESLVDIVNESRSTGSHVAAIFMEPLSSFGQEMATATFYKKVIDFAKS